MGWLWGFGGSSCGYKVEGDSREGKGEFGEEEEEWWMKVRRRRRKGGGDEGDGRR